MANQELRLEAASKLRALGHDFVARDLNDGQFEEIVRRLDELLDVVAAADLRPRTISPEGLANFKMVVPEADAVVEHQLFSDSIVSGGANPMGLGALLWRDDDDAVMEVTLGKAFEGAPGRAHGGVVAALIDETMGLVNAIGGVLTFTEQLDIKFEEPVPVDEPVVARARLVSHHGRKYYVEARVTSGDTVVASATALFIAIDPTKFLEHVPVRQP